MPHGLYPNAKRNTDHSVIEYNTDHSITEYTTDYSGTEHNTDYAGTECHTDYSSDAGNIPQDAATSEGGALAALFCCRPV